MIARFLDWLAGVPRHQRDLPPEPPVPICGTVPCPFLRHGGCGRADELGYGAWRPDTAGRACGVAGGPGWARGTR